MEEMIQHCQQELNKNWERLAQLHMHIKDSSVQDNSECVFVFPLSFVAEKCYNYEPIQQLSKLFTSFTYSKETIFMNFQVIFLPYGYSEKKQGVFVKTKATPHKRIIIRWNNPEDYVIADSFQDAAIAFLSEPFLDDKEIKNSQKKDFSQDQCVIHSIQMNSSIWIIGPFIPSVESENKPNTRLFYRIAAAVTYRSTSDGSFIDYIRSLHTDDPIMVSAPWELNLLKCPERDICPSSTEAINSRRLGVLLLSTIQQLSKMTNSSHDLFLQSAYNSSSFIQFIKIGFLYSSPESIVPINTSTTVATEFPICCNFQEELPEAFHNLFGTSDMVYLTAEKGKNRNIRLLTMKKLLVDFFPPMYQMTDHPMLVQWLYSVPFPSP